MAKPKKIDTFIEECTTYTVFLAVEHGVGSFYCEVSPGNTIVHGTLDGCIKASREWLRQNAALRWEAVIVIDRREWYNDHVSKGSHSLRFTYDRKFRAKRPDGSYVWRSWQATDEIPPGGLSWDDTYEGKPNTASYAASRDEIVIDYTPDRWRALRTITHAVAALRDKLGEMLAAEKVVGFLGDVTSGAVQMLGYTKKGKKR